MVNEGPVFFFGEDEGLEELFHPLGNLRVRDGLALEGQGRFAELLTFHFQGVLMHFYTMRV